MLSVTELLQLKPRTLGPGFVLEWQESCRVVRAFHEFLEEGWCKA